MTTFELKPEYISQMVARFAELLLDYYVFPEIAENMSKSLLAQLANGEYYNEVNGHFVASKITKQLLQISNDKHLELIYSEKPISTIPFDPSSADHHSSQQLNNYGFQKVERLAGNVGHLVINSFEYPQFAGETAAYAMSFLAHTDGLIIDLRSNHGGSSFMTALIASYLLESYPPIHLHDTYWRYYDKVQSFWSLPSVPGKKFGASKPIYVLTSSRTASGGEEFAYNLQALQRAKIVGEQTSGKANAGSVHRINDHFQAFIPNAYVINPTTAGSWNDIGVIPDIKTLEDAAFDKAYQLLLQQLLEQYSDSQAPGRQRVNTEIVKAIQVK